MLYVWRTSYKGNEKNIYLTIKKLAFGFFLFQKIVSRNNAKSKFLLEGLSMFISFVVEK
jgi:hypothetical protein